MLKYLIIAFAVVFASAASAQSAPQQSIEELQAQYLFETGQLRQALGQAQAQNIQLRKENVELKAKFEAKPEVKK